jgi:hypothetical protein
MKIDWSDIVNKIIVAVAIALIGSIVTIGAMYISSEIEKGIEKEVELLQQEQIDEQEARIISCEELEKEIIIKVDSNQIRNSKDHLLLVEGIQDVKKELKILTYVIKKNNSVMKKELNYIKQIQYEQNYITEK